MHKRLLSYMRVISNNVNAWSLPKNGISKRTFLRSSNTFFAQNATRNMRTRPFSFLLKRSA